MSVLTQDVRSVLKGRQLYGRKNDKVKVIADYGSILIVEGTKWAEEKGKPVEAGIHRYSVKKELVK